MRFRLIALSLLFAVAAVAGVWTRQAGPAQLALEAAKKTEVVDRNLLAAIAQYRDVAAKFESDLAVAPAALLKMAECYEQLGQPEWRATYERIVKYYPDSAPAKTARVKLLEQRQGGLTTTQLTDAAGRSASVQFLSGQYYDPPTPFLDGRYFTDTNTSGDLVVRDVRLGRTRALTRKSKTSADRLGRYSLPSPDGRQIAYVWISGKAFQLRVISFDGGTDRVLVADAVSRVYAWSGDSKQVLFSLARRAAGQAWDSDLMTIPASGGAPRSLKQNIGGLELGSAAWSPDGRFIVYDARPASGDTTEHDLFIMRADGSNTEPLVVHAASDLVLHWFPDGKRLLFLSDRAGTYSMWAQSIADGKAVGEPTLVKALAGQIHGQGFTQDGSYYYNVTSVTHDVLIARLNASGTLSGTVEPLPVRFSGGKMDGAWSPDGSQIAYVNTWSEIQQPPLLRSLSILTVSTREVRTIPVELRSMGKPAWTPDGRAVIVHGIQPKGGQGLFRIDLRAGEVGTIGELATTDAASRWYPAVSADGGEVFFLGQQGLQAQDLVSGRLRTLFNGPALTFALSPDGRFAAVASPNPVSATDHAPRFRIVPIAGGESRSIGAELAPAWHDLGFAWSADSRYLFFARSDDIRIALWRIPVNGGPAQQTDLPFPNERRLFRISVHPDGRLAITTEAVGTEYWVMRNIPPAAKR